MLALDFINVGNGDSILIRELENGQQRYALMVDFGHDCLVRVTTPASWTPAPSASMPGTFSGSWVWSVWIWRWRRISTGTTSAGWAGCWTPPRVGTFVTTYLPPPNAPELEPDEDNGLPGRPARNALRCVQLYTKALQSHSDRIERFCCIPGTETVTLR